MIRTPPTSKVEYATQLENARELVRQHGIDMKYDPHTGKFLTWSGQAWVSDNTGRVPRWTKDIARETWERLKHLDSKLVARFATSMESANGVSGVMTLAATELGIPVEHTDLDADPWLLNCRNNSIDLRTCEPKDHAREDLCTKIAPVTYDPLAECPLWLKFLDRIMEGNLNLIGYLQRLAGLCLTGDHSVHEFWILHGSGFNGKNTFFDTVLGLLGPYAGTAPDSLLMQRKHPEHSTQLADLCGRRLVVASETEKGGCLEVQRMKKLTGDATIKARYMNKDFFEFQMTHKLWMVTNHKPKIGDDGAAVWGRVRLIPFSVTIPEAERDGHLTDKLVAERPGILNWCLEGCRAYQRGGMNPPAEVLTATATYRQEANELSEFFEQRTLTGAELRVSRNEIFDSYRNFALQAGEKSPLDRTDFFEQVRRLGGVEDDSWRSAGVVVRGFTGIGILATTQAETEGGI